MRKAVVAATLALTFAEPAAALDGARLERAVRAEERALNARVGAAVLDTKDATTWSYRGAERFALDSTHKAFACAALLAEADRGEISMTKRVVITAADLAPNSPITEKNLAPASMSLGEICGAALDYSDNTAANFVLATLGGPSAVTAFFRALGDKVSRLDRKETELNDATPGDPRDTTTPAAAAADLSKILLGDALKRAPRARLTQWMEGDRVAGPLLRAALPEGWRIADKTGAGGHGSRGIVAAIWPPGRPPLVVAIYIAETPADMAARNAAIARIGAALVEAIAP